MKIPTVELHDELVVREHRVGLVAGDVDVAVRRGSRNRAQKATNSSSKGDRVGFWVGSRNSSRSAAPGWVGNRWRASASWARVRNGLWSASLTRRVRVRGSRVGALSRIVRAGLVVRMPSWVRMSWGARVRQRWTVMPFG
jgi:hypothetical protein